MNGKKRWMILIAVSCLLVSMACNLSATDPDVTPTANQGGDANPTRPPRPAATATPVPDVPDPSGCTLNGAFEADVTVPDGKEFPSGTPFVKTWRMRNSGSCPWKAGTRLVFVSGDRMDGPPTVNLASPVAPGDDTAISVDLVAPPAPGTYTGHWQLESPDGTSFGSIIYVQIVVPAAPATSAPPTSQPQPTPAATSSTPPDLYVTDVTIDPEVPVTGTPFSVLALLHNDGTAPLVGVTVRVEDHFPHAHASCDNMSMTNTIYETTQTLGAGETVPVDYAVQIDDAWEHLICVKIDPDGTIAESDESNNADGESVLVGTLTQISLDPANSGSIRADGNTAYTNAQPGDGPNDMRVEGFLSWDLSGLPAGTTILAAEIHWSTQCFQGGDLGDCSGARDPFPTLGDLAIRAHFFDTLEASDFTGSGVGTLIATYTAQPTGSLVVTESVADAYDNGQPYQLYLIFDEHTDNNGIGNGLVFPEGSGPNTLDVIHMP